MPRHYDDSQQSSTVKTRRQQEDQRRMAFRRAIESYSEARRLNQELCDYEESVSERFWQAARPMDDARRNVQQAG